MSIHIHKISKNSLVKLHQEGRSLKSLAEEFGPSKVILFGLNKLPQS